MSDVTSDYERIEKRTRIHGNIRNGVIYFFLCLWALILPCGTFGDQSGSVPDAWFLYGGWIFQ